MRRSNLFDSRVGFKFLLFQVQGLSLYLNFKRLPYYPKRKVNPLSNGFRRFWDLMFPKMLGIALH